MDNYENAMQYINEQETTNISYAKIGKLKKILFCGLTTYINEKDINNKKLVVSFASNGLPEKDFFQRKTSLMKLKYERNDFDVLYLRNQSKWYLGGLPGIGKNINCTIAFLKKEFAKYDKVCCIGGSAGGYASLLFGSLLKVNRVITINAQTDLQYCVDNIDPCGKTEQMRQKEKQNLIKRSKECPVTWSKYNKIVNVLNENVIYNVFYTGDEIFNQKESDGYDIVVHGDYHYDQIKTFPSVSKFNSTGIFRHLKMFLDE